MVAFYKHPENEAEQFTNFIDFYQLNRKMVICFLKQ